MVLGILLNSLISCCFWINNCVGFHNMKYFYLTLVYGTLGCGYMLCIFLLRWFWAIEYDLSLPWFDVPILLFSTVFISAQLYFLARLLAMHSFLISKDRTAVEHRCCKGEKPGTDICSLLMKCVKTNTTVSLRVCSCYFD